MTAAVSLPMTVAEFDAGKQATFKTAIAAVPGVSNADVTIVKIESISSARRGGAIRHVTMRHLLAAGIRINISVKAANQNAGDALGAKLTVTAINAQLQQAGLLATTILEAARTAPSGEGSSTSDGTAGGGMLPVIVGVAVGLTVLLAIALFLYRRYRQKVTETQGATAMSELASAELGMRPPAAPAAILPDIEAHVGTPNTPGGKLCADCGAMNDVSNEICQDCRKYLHRKDVAGFCLSRFLFTSMKCSSDHSEG